MIPTNTPLPHATSPDPGGITDLHAPRSVPPVSSRDVSHTLTSQYGIEPLGLPQRMESYWDFNFKVATPIGPLFCKAYTHDQFEDARFHADVLTKLASEGILVPPVVTSRHNATVGEINGLPFIVQRFLPGESLANLTLTRPMIFELGETLAQIHNSLEGRCISGNTFKRTSWDPRQHELLFSRFDAAVEHFSLQAQRELDTLRGKIAEFLPNLRELPTGITHGDYHPGNILVAHRKIAAVLDFNEAIDSWLLGDIGIALSYMNNQELPLLQCAKSFIAGYRSERPLALFERVFIPVLIQLRAATRLIETGLDSNRESREDLKLIRHLNDPKVFEDWVRAL